MAMNLLHDPGEAARSARRLDALIALALIVFMVLGTYFAAHGQPGGSCTTPSVITSRSSTCSRASRST
ncbi:MAG TPA: hypothetical protein VFM81_04110 [Actinomycetota bacterium]|nr:hypothetical protein [Actinomycetota bacterium]